MHKLTDELGRAALLLSRYNAILPVPDLFQINGDQFQRITLVWSSRYDFDGKTNLSGVRAVCAWADAFGEVLSMDGYNLYARLDIEGQKVTVRTDLYGDQRKQLSEQHGVILIPDTAVTPSWLLSIMAADEEMPRATLSCR